MFHKAVELKVLSGTAMEVSFQDGAVKQYDISVLFTKYPQMRLLTDRSLFLSGQLISPYGIIWNDDLDLETETVYEEGILIRTKKPAPFCQNRPGFAECPGKSRFITERIIAIFRNRPV